MAKKQKQRVLVELSFTQGLTAKEAKQYLEALLEAGLKCAALHPPRVRRLQVSKINCKEAERVLEFEKRELFRKAQEAISRGNKAESELKTVALANVRLADRLERYDRGYR